MDKGASGCSSCGKESSCSAKGQKPEESPEQYQQRMEIERRLCRIQNKILVMSGKGGVGKSSTAVNLSIALMQEENAVGLLDVDIHGPSVPKMLGLDNHRPVAAEEGMIPANYLGLRTMSIGFMLEKPSDALIWRGPVKAGVIQQMIVDVDWGYLDYLVVDCPPGTGDEPLSVAQFLGEVNGAVIVTTPQDVALLDVSKSITFCRQLNLPILGIIENMSGFVCPKCGEVVDIFKSGGGEKLAAEMNVPFLGRIPVDGAMVESGDAGKPYIIAHPDTETANAFRTVARGIIAAAKNK